MTVGVCACWSVDVEGYHFALPAELTQIGTESSRVRSDGVPAADIPGMRILWQLIDEEIAAVREQDVMLPHSAVSDLAPEDARALSLPDVYPFTVEIRGSSTLPDPAMKYTSIYMDGSRRPFVNPQRIGTLLRITSDQEYLVTGSLYRLLEAVDSHNRAPEQERSARENLLGFAEIKELAGESGSALEQYLAAEEVISPSMLAVRLKHGDDDTLEIEPVLSKVSATEDGDETVNPILEQDKAQAFTDIFDRLASVREVYPIPDGPRVVLNEPQKSALEQIKKLRSISGEQKEAFLSQPQSFLDPEVVYLDDFSERVREVGEYRPRVFPFLRAQKESWLPPEGGVIIDGSPVYLTTAEAKELRNRIEVARTDQDKEVQWKGQAIPTTEEVCLALDALVEPEAHSAAGSASLRGEDRQLEKKILVIKDNFEEAEHVAEEAVRPGNPGQEPSALEASIELLPHQTEGLTWLQTLWVAGAHGALLADDMGLGKTLQALTFMAWVRELLDGTSCHAVKPMLVVAPVALLDNWADEYERFLHPVFGAALLLHGSELRRFQANRALEVRGATQETQPGRPGTGAGLAQRDEQVQLRCDEISQFGLVMTTYETVRNHQFSLGRIDWAVMVVDEAQKVKTPSAMVTLAVKAMKYDFGLGMTGTPVENSWVDLWSLMDFVQPGRLGSLKEFVRTFQTPLGRPDTDRESLGLLLKDRVGGQLKRRMKEDHLKGLPRKHVSVYEVDMPQLQLERYLGVVEQARIGMADPERPGRKQHILNTIAALRDVSLCPHLPFLTDQGLSDLSEEDLVGSSARICKSMEILGDVQARSEKAIVFLISRKAQRVVQRLVESRYGIHAHIVNGEVAGGRRKALIDAFQSTNGFNVIIMSPEAAGVGLNVVAANHVIHLSRAWNPAKEDQATDRVYRIGQDRDVYVHIPLAVHPLFETAECGGTFDLKLHRLLEEKRKLSRSVLLPSGIGGDEWERIGSEIVAPIGSAKRESQLDEATLDQLTPDLFEETVAAIYRNAGCQVERTPATRDWGADVIALPHETGCEARLIQCKHTSSPGRNQGVGGVQEILAAQGVYASEFGRDFTLAVATNASDFTSRARELAAANGVQLISRADILELLDRHEVRLSQLTVV